MNVLEALHQAIDRLRRDDDVDVLLLGAENAAEDIVQLTVAISLYGSDESRERWSISCAGVSGSQFSIHDYTENLVLTQDHPVLVPHVEPSSELYFSRKPPNASAVLGDLYAIHEDRFGDWFPFRQFVMGNAIKHIADGFGRLAAGPESLIDAYRAVAERHGMQPSQPLPRGATHGDERTLHALVMGSSYVVARSFEAKRIT